MKNKYTLWGLVIGVAAVILGVVVFSCSTLAVTVDSFLPKVYAEGIFTCYEDGVLKSSLGSLSNYSTPVYSLISSETTNKNSSVPLVTGLASADSVKCSELLFGKDYDGWSYWHDGEVLSGLFANWPNGAADSWSGTPASSEADQKTYLQKLGYVETSEMIENGKCARFRFTNTNIIPGTRPTEGGTYVPPAISDDVLVLSSEICAELIGDDGIKSLSVENNTTDDFIVFSLHDNTGGQLNSEYSDAAYAARMTYRHNDTVFGEDTATWYYNEGGSFSAMLQWWLENIKESDSLIQRGFSLSVSHYYLYVSDPIELTPVTTRNETYAFPDNGTDATAAAATAMKSVYPQFTSYPDLAFSPAEELALYTYYLNDYYNVTSICDPDDYAQSAMNEGWVQVQLYDSTTGALNSNCYVEQPFNADEEVNGLDASKHFGTPINFDELITALNSIDPSDISAEDLTDLPTIPSYGAETGGNTPGGTTPGASPDEVTDACYDTAGALGWIICPVARFLDSSLGSVYEWVEDNFLITRADIFSNNATGVENTWRIFRDIANVVMIVLLLIVIVSQVTGFGVSNYGIKKMLPRLVVTAVLINVSYFICELFIDVSNIVGSGLKEMFDGLVPLDQSLLESTGAGAANQAGTFLLSVVGMTGFAFAVVLNPAVLITILLFLLSGLISVLFLWFLLVARQAGVILAVILSPVAFACYLLPNTQNLFKRYTKVLQGLLLLYPICGLVVGGGAFASRIIANVGATSPDLKTPFILASLALQVLPFFLIPSLLRNSFAALGNIGNKISGFGKGLSRGATRRIENTETVKNARRLGMERKIRIKSGLDKDGNETARGRRMRARANSRIGRVFGADRRLAAKRAATDKIRNDSIGALASLSSYDHGLLGDSDGFSADGDFTGTLGVDSTDMERFAQAYQNGDEQGVETMAQLINSKYGSSGVKAIGDYVRRFGSTNTADTARNTRREQSMAAMNRVIGSNRSFAQSLSDKASGVYQYITARGRAASSDRTLGITAGDHVGTDFYYQGDHDAYTSDVKSFASQSTSELRAKIAGGALDADMIRSILSSTDTSVQSGLQSDAAKRNLLNVALAELENGTFNAANYAVGARTGADFTREYNTLGDAALARQLELDRSTLAHEAYEALNDIRDASGNVLYHSGEHIQLRVRSNGDYVDNNGRIVSRDTLNQLAHINVPHPARTDSGVIIPDGHTITDSGIVIPRNGNPPRNQNPPQNQP